MVDFHLMKTFKSQYLSNRLAARRDDNDRLHVHNINIIVLSANFKHRSYLIHLWLTSHWLK